MGHQLVANCLKKDHSSGNEKGTLGKVTTGSKEQPVCIPGNLTIMVPVTTSSLPSKTMCLVKQETNHSLPLSLVVNRCLTDPKQEWYQ